jgi:hypothetical protein
VVRRLILVPLLAVACASAMAQRDFSAGHFGARPSGRFASHRGGHSRGRGAYPLGPLYWDSLFSDDSLDSENPPLAPPVVVVQSPAAQSETAPWFGQEVHPLLIELRGGRYVRISGDESSNSETSDPQLESDASHAASPPSAPPASTVLIFRDGRREQITNYTIAAGVLYAQSNYYTEGSWNKPIALSSLDLSATMNENRARGVRFQVPGAPNQVIVGP